MKNFNLEKAIFGALTGHLEKDPYKTIITYANPLAIDLIGPELLGMRVPALFGAILGDAQLGQQKFETLLSGQSIQLEGQFGTRFIYLNSIIDPSASHWQASLFDVTERRQSQQVFEYTASSLARAAEVYDDDTGEHINRINILSGKLAGLYGEDPEFISRISFYAQLHDVGKIHIDPNIIRKPGRLTESEFNEIKKHTIYGARIIGNHPALRMGRRIALSHHEKWDGSGYPHGLAGEAIPLEARIVAIVDVFDALMSPRAYKPAFSPEKVYSIFTEGDDRLNPAGHFDPTLRSIFLDDFDTFVRLYRDLGTSDARSSSVFSLTGKETADLSSLMPAAKV